ncbi:MAG TPA: ATP-binding cassette domain-containing protein [Oscillatoriaceae cyanobacterium]
MTLEVAPEPAIAFERTSLRLPDGRALIADLDLAVAPGETLVLLGQSGCGKSTTLRLINRLLEPTDGLVRVQGRPTREWDPIALRRRIGYVIQEAGLFPHRTVAENVGLVPRLERWEPARIAARVSELLALVGLPHDQFADRYPHQLSGGQRQRIGIARALAADAPILLLDEPFSALDPLTRRELQRELKALNARLGKTIVFVTHDVREAFYLADRIALLRAGKLVLWGDRAAFETSEDAEVKAFLEVLREEAA